MCRPQSLELCLGEGLQCSLGTVGHERIVADLLSRGDPGIKWPGHQGRQDTKAHDSSDSSLHWIACRFRHGLPHPGGR